MKAGFYYILQQFINNIIIILLSFIYIFSKWGLGIGDWGLAQSPIPNPQSPIPNPHKIHMKKWLDKQP